jgi:hypothetical protein
MFGTDYPHMEGMWPNTWDWIRATLSKIPEVEARQILGENAINFYGLDRGILEEAALRCGPLSADLLGDQPVDPALLENFHTRGGIDKRPDLHEQELKATVRQDVDEALSARPS